MKARNRIDLLVLFMLVLAAVALGWYYPSIPSEVPSHYGFNGKSDALSPKSFLWELYGFLFALQIILYLTSRINPRHYNYPFKIREENRHLVYRETQRMLDELRLFILFLFLAILGLSACSVMTMPVWFFLLILILPNALIIKGIVRMSQANKTKQDANLEDLK